MPSKAVAVAEQVVMPTAEKPSIGMDFIASGEISAGQTVGLKSDGTIEVITGTSSGTVVNVGTPTVYESAKSTSSSATFDSSQNKIVVAYRDEGNSHRGTAVVGTVSGSSISFGAPVTFTSSTAFNFSAIFDSSQNKVVIAYRDDGNSFWGTAIVGTVSGTSISFGTPEVFAATTVDYPSATFDSNSNKVVIAYRDSTDSARGKGVVGTVSGTSISFGTPATFTSSITSYVAVSFDSNSNKAVIGYRDDSNSKRGTAVVGTVSGTSISFGAPVVFESSTIYFMTSAFDSDCNKVVFAYRAGSGKAAVGTVSGTSISFGTPVTFYGASVSNMSATFDSNSNKVVIACMAPLSGTNVGTAVIGSIYENSISFDTTIVYRSGAPAWHNAATFDSITNQVVIAYADNGNSDWGTGITLELIEQEGTTNASSWIGIARETIASGSSGLINLVGSIDNNQTGLTIGASYYLNYDGTLTTVPNEGVSDGTHGKVGMALSPTQLHLTK